MSDEPIRVLTAEDLVRDNNELRAKVEALQQHNAALRQSIASFGAERLAATRCPYIRNGDDGTQYCALAERESDNLKPSPAS